MKDWCRILQVLVPFFCIFPKHLVQNCTSPARFRYENTAGKGVKRQEMLDNPTPYTLSYTQTYTRKYQSLLGFSIPGVGSVGDFQKTFFLGGGGRMSKRLLHEGGREFQNIGLLCIKPPYFCPKKSDVSDFQKKTVFYQNGCRNIVVVSFCGVPATARQKVARRRWNILGVHPSFSANPHFNVH